MASASAPVTEIIQPTADDCRAQLARILESPDFEATDRERRFLSYVVEETVAGRADRIKAYSVALEVFGRDSSFDPQNDPVVRIEAGHVRRALERYYLMAGRADPVIITIPKGSYVPSFAFRIAPPTGASTKPAPALSAPKSATTGWRRPSRLAWLVIAHVAVIAVMVMIAHSPLWTGSPTASDPDIPRLAVGPFEDLAGIPPSARIAAGLTEEVIGQLAKFKDIVVIHASPGGGLAATAVSEGGAVLPRYALEGSVDLSAKDLRIQVRLVKQADRSIVWANTYDGDLEVGRFLNIQADIASQVATALGQPYGVVFQADASELIDNPPGDWEAYACTLSYYSYRANLDAKSHPAIRDCLERAVARFPDYATAWALLSQIYVDEIRFRYPAASTAPPTSIDRALQAARRAVALDRQNVRGLQAEMLALYFAGDMHAALKLGEEAMTINPNDTELMGEYGFRLALSGEWPRGCRLVTKSRELNPGPLAYYETALALCAYFGGDHQQAAVWIKKTTVPANTIYHMVAAAIFAEGGFAADAARERDWLLQNAPAFAKNMRPEIETRLGRAEDADRFIASLRKAGFEIPPGVRP